MDDNRTDGAYHGIAACLLVAILLAVGGWALLGGGKNEQPPSIGISRKVVGDDWPLTVDAGTLRCEAGAVTIEVDGTTYSVNGMADSRANEKGWADITPIWAEDPAGLGPRKSIGPLIKAGLRLCEENQ